MAKRQRAEQSCFLCEKAGPGVAADCNGQRPCNRCLQLGIPHMCVSATVAPAPRAQSSAVAPAQPDQQQINQYFLAEIQRMQRAHEEMYNEITQLKKEKQDLSNELEKVKSSQRELTYATSAAHSAAIAAHSAAVGTGPLGTVANGPEPPMVVYTFVGGSAKVLTANAIFCSMLGYTMEEVLEADWKKFIQPEYVLRVQDLGTSMPSGNQIVISQCYVHKSGAVFWTKDSMTIFRDSEGKPSTALVTVQMASRPTMNPTAPAFAPIAPKQLPTLTYKALDPASEPLAVVPPTGLDTSADGDMLMEDFSFLDHSTPSQAEPAGGDDDDFQQLVDSLLEGGEGAS
mmetsp:Transcript_13957/g.55073  ORF Transcript_13957/g.55073 Transcript_13957/m.55073 type:complete len:343 (-) Transcript_13957:58-1086(-)